MWSSRSWRRSTTRTVQPACLVHISESRYKLHCGEFSGPCGPLLKDVLDVIVPGLPRARALRPARRRAKRPLWQLGHTGPRRYVSPVVFSTIAVPFAMGNVRSALAYVNTPVVGWDNSVKGMLQCNSTSARIKKAVVRGRTQWKGMKFGTCTQSCGWEDNGRWLLHMLGESHPGMFDAYVTKIHRRSNGSGFLPLTEQLCNYQAILNVGSANDWAERLRQCFYGNAVVILPENPPSEFFNSFMRAWRHSGPASLTSAMSLNKCPMSCRRRTRRGSCRVRRILPESI
ncbi:unnamed protein product [Prorocentrum cordatum]|uniref:Protein xylosyltransferase n=1 Tax=Prorocentrum cordatum TaxID=2364126 RepID=A0ABN9S7I0_9DINO|nr:unnamed protein product [Polarella glacialis]